MDALTESITEDDDMLGHESSLVSLALRAESLKKHRFEEFVGACSAFTVFQRRVEDRMVRGTVEWSLLSSRDEQHEEGFLRRGAFSESMQTGSEKQRVMHRRFERFTFRQSRETQSFIRQSLGESVIRLSFRHCAEIPHGTHSGLLRYFSLDRERYPGSSHVLERSPCHTHSLGDPRKAFLREANRDACGHFGCVIGVISGPSCLALFALLC